MVRRKARIRRKLPIAKTLRPVSVFPSSAPENPWLRNSRKSDIMECNHRFFLRGQTNWCLSLRLQVSCHCETSPQTGRGNPPVRGEMYRKVPGRMGVAAIFGGNRYLVPFNRGIATPVCALARNDSISLQTPICLSSEEKPMIAFYYITFPTVSQPWVFRCR